MTMASTLHAHPADISYLRARLERHRAELRFTFNLLTLSRFAAVDADQDKQVSPAELEAARPALQAYLGKHIQLRINDQAVKLGPVARVECVWPDAAQGVPVAEADWGARYVDLVMDHPVQALLADLWLGFDIWRETGPLGTVEATYEQGELRMQVPFSPSEPDYLYDTGFAVEELFQPPAVAALSEAPSAGLISNESEWQRLQPLAWPAVGLALVVLLFVTWLRWRRDV